MYSIQSTASIWKAWKICWSGANRQLLPWIQYSLFALQCLLNEEEIEIKTKLWMEENKDYLEKQKGLCLTNNNLQ